MEFEALLKSFGEKLGIELKPDENLACSLEIDGMPVVLQGNPAQQVVCIWGDLGEPPPQGLESLYAAMLEANDMFRGTDGATLSRDAESGAFHLCRIIDIRLVETDEFAGVVGNFVNTLELWRRLVHDYRPVISQSEEKEVTPASLKPGDFIVA